MSFISCHIFTSFIYIHVMVHVNWCTCPCVLLSCKLTCVLLGDSNVSPPCLICQGSKVKITDNYLMLTNYNVTKCNATVIVLFHVYSQPLPTAIAFFYPLHTKLPTVTFETPSLCGNSLYHPDLHQFCEHIFIVHWWTSTPPHLNVVWGTGSHCLVEPAKHSTAPSSSTTGIASTVPQGVLPGYPPTPSFCCKACFTIEVSANKCRNTGVVIWITSAT